MSDYLLGIDIGATNTRIAIVDHTGSIIASERMPSQMSAGAPFSRKWAPKPAVSVKLTRCRLLARVPRGSSTTRPACTCRDSIPLPLG